MAVEASAGPALPDAGSSPEWGVTPGSAALALVVEAGGAAGGSDLRSQAPRDKVAAIASAMLEQTDSDFINPHQK
jgi:hypothetical protein